MDKVKLPREVAEAIEAARQLKFPNSEIVAFSFIAEDHGSHRNAIRDFAADNFDVFISALVNGYEVEETPEEKIRKQYELWGRDAQLIPESSMRYNGMRIGMTDTLDMLGIKIEGVNA